MSSAAAPPPAAVLFPPLEARRQGSLAVDALHTLYWEEAGHPQGLPVLVLHGGPGAGSSPLWRRFFDPAVYRIIQFDQRGAGRSTPLGATAANTTALLVADIETLRQWCGIERWLVWGGSWGSTLALAYGQAHPEHCLGFLLRSIFLGTSADIDWFFRGGAAYHPEAYAEFAALLTPAERSDLLAAYCARLADPDPAVQLAAARSWSRYEQQRATLLPLTRAAQLPNDALDLPLARLEAHYFQHQCFLAPDQLIAGMAALAHLPALLVHGRYDMLCPPAGAYRLLQAWPGARLVLVPDAGHSSFEPGTQTTLLQAAVTFAQQGHF